MCAPPWWDQSCRVHTGSCKNLPFPRWSQKFACRFACKAWHFVNFDSVSEGMCVRDRRGSRKLQKLSFSTLYTPHFHSTLHTHTLHPALYIQTFLFSLYTPLSTLCTLHFRLRTLHSSLCTLHFILHTLLHSTFHTLHSFLHTLHSTL